uniref:Uncharacterized protein n=1 Tax=Rhizophora mucronata TaxID=61149 RepID=A0A2P2PWY2_RHIMU
MGLVASSPSNPLPNPPDLPISDAKVLILPLLDLPTDADPLLVLLFFLQPPPIGTFLRAPPLVQYRRQVLQKWRG